MDLAKWDKSGKPGEERQGLVKTSKEPDAATRVQVQAIYSKLPLHFEANQGQTDKESSFYPAEWG
jgi:hypothetical protein